MKFLRRRLQTFTSLPFLFALTLLIINDFYWKAIYANIWTGKISDFAGLFVFVIFWSALFAKKRTATYFVTAIIFIWWKSPFSQSFIEGFSQTFYSIDRVVDATDLWALTILPVAYYFEKSIAAVKFNIPSSLIGGIAFFAFCSTSHSLVYHIIERPQYILFDEFPVTKHGDHYSMCHSAKFITDTIRKKTLVIPTEIRSRYPSYEDGYTYVEFCRGLPQNVLCEFIASDSLRNTFTKRFLTSGSFQISHYQRDSTIEKLNFQNGRLHGEYKKWTLDSTLVVEGQYDKGIEMGLWNYYNKNGQLIKQMEFLSGELVMEQTFDNKVVTDTKTFTTRSQVIQKHCWLLILEISIGLCLLYFFIQNQSKTPYKSEKWMQLPMLDRLLLSLISIVIAVAFYLYLIANLTILQLSTNFPFGIIVLAVMVLPLVLLGAFQIVKIKNYSTIGLLIVFSVISLLIIDQILFIIKLTQ